MPAIALVGLLALPASHFERNVRLDGATRFRPAVAFQHEMRTAERRVTLHLVFKRGLKGTSGVVVEVNDATRKTHPEKNPFAAWRAPSPHWKAGKRPGVWFTSARTTKRLERPIVLRFDKPGRYRIRISGLPDEGRREAPTLVGITEGVDDDVPKNPRRR